jgi:hypothetical protein
VGPRPERSVGLSRYAASAARGPIPTGAASAAEGDRCAPFDTDRGWPDPRQSQKHPYAVHRDPSDAETSDRPEHRDPQPASVVVPNPAAPPGLSTALALLAAPAGESSAPGSPCQDASRGAEFPPETASPPQDGGGAWVDWKTRLVSKGADVGSTPTRPHKRRPFHGCVSIPCPSARVPRPAERCSGRAIAPSPSMCRPPRAFQPPRAQAAAD